jgi:3-hydroxyacyl-[acyl-carrier-protein] dehydratase
LKDFYSITDHAEIPVENNTAGITERRHSFTIELNPDHDVYAGHFPGSPVVPGVCQIQVIRELIGQILQGNVILEYADNIKFLSLIVPGECGKLVFDISYKETGPGRISANVTIHSSNTLFLKFKGIFSRS